MASFFDRLFGVQDIPQFYQPTMSEMMTHVEGQVPQMNRINNAFNLGKAPGDAAAIRAFEDVYDPGIGALRALTTSGISDRFKSRGDLAPDTLRNILQTGFERGSLTGLGRSGSGRNLVAADIGRRTEDQINEIISLTGNWVRSNPQLFQPQTPMNPSMGMNQLQGAANSQNAWEQYVSQIQGANATKKIQGPKNLMDQTAGTVLGYMFGTNALGPAISGIAGGLSNTNAPDTEFRANPSPRSDSGFMSQLRY